MAAITLQKLKKLLGDAYEAGYGNSLELKACYVEEIAAAILGEPEETFGPNEGWKVFKVRELREIAVGTIFDHSARGKCWVELHHGSRERHMKFENGEICHFYQDSRPWDEPMRIIGGVKNTKGIF